MSIIKTMQVDDFYTNEVAQQITNTVSNLPFIQTDLGKQIENFNMVSDDVDELFSNALNKKVIVDKENSGIFRFPELFIHFESFDSPKDWMFAVALGEPYTTFNIFEHQSGAKSALQEHRHNYKNLFEWDLTVNYQLQPGQGIFFRPWLFHAFDTGLIQIFRLKEE